MDSQIKTKETLSVCTHCKQEENVTSETFEPLDLVGRVLNSITLLLCKPCREQFNQMWDKVQLLGSKEDTSVVEYCKAVDQLNQEFFV